MQLPHVMLIRRQTIMPKRGAEVKLMYSLY